MEGLIICNPSFSSAYKISIDRIAESSKCPHPRLVTSKVILFQCTWKIPWSKQNSIDDLVYRRLSWMKNNIQSQALVSFCRFRSIAMSSTVLWRFFEFNFSITNGVACSISGTEYCILQHLEIASSIWRCPDLSRKLKHGPRRIFTFPIKLAN